jgi:magnesium transporter
MAWPDMTEKTSPLLPGGYSNPAEQLSERLAEDQGAVAWLDLYEPTEADLQIVMEEFGPRPLAVEDAVTPHQRPKVDCCRSRLFAAGTPSRSAAPGDA